MMSQPTDLCTDSHKTQRVMLQLNKCIAQYEERIANNTKIIAQNHIQARHLERLKPTHNCCECCTREFARITKRIEALEQSNTALLTQIQSDEIQLEFFKERKAQLIQPKRWINYRCACCKCEMGVYHNPIEEPLEPSDIMCDMCAHTIDRTGWVDYREYLDVLRINWRDEP